MVKSYFGFYVIVYFMGPHVGVDTGRMLFALERERRKSGASGKTFNILLAGGHFDYKS
jgi:hypothetical protein